MEGCGQRDMIEHVRGRRGRVVGSEQRSDEPAPRPGVAARGGGVAAEGLRQRAFHLADEVTGELDRRDRHAGSVPQAKRKSKRNASGVRGSDGRPFRLRVGSPGRLPRPGRPWSRRRPRAAPARPRPSRPRASRPAVGLPTPSSSSASSASSGCPTSIGSRSDPSAFVIARLLGRLHDPGTRRRRCAHPVRRSGYPKSGSLPGRHLMPQPTLGRWSPEISRPSSRASIAARRSSPVTGTSLPGRLESNWPR